MTTFRPRIMDIILAPVVAASFSAAVIYLVELGQNQAWSYPYAMVAMLAGGCWVGILWCIYRERAWWLGAAIGLAVVFLYFIAMFALSPIVAHAIAVAGR